MAKKKADASKAAAKEAKKEKAAKKDGKKEAKNALKAKAAANANSGGGGKKGKGKIKEEEEDIEDILRKVSGRSCSAYGCRSSSRNRRVCIMVDPKAITKRGALEVDAGDIFSACDTSLRSAMGFRPQWFIS